MSNEFFTKDKLQRFDDMLINLVGLRADIHLLPSPLIAEILKRAQTDLLFVIEGFKDAWEK